MKTRFNNATRIALLAAFMLFFQIIWSDAVNAAPAGEKLPAAIAKQYTAATQIDWNVSPKHTYYVVYAKVENSYRVEVRDRKGALKSVVRNTDTPFTALKGMTVTDDGMHAVYWLEGLNGTHNAYVWQLAALKAKYAKNLGLDGEVFKVETFNHGVRFQVYYGKEKLPVQRDLEF